MKRRLRVSIQGGGTIGIYLNGKQFDKLRKGWQKIRKRTLDVEDLLHAPLKSCISANHECTGIVHTL